jgi:hypothetical protein
MSDPSAIALRIEQHLLARADWVSVAEICERFGVDQRDIRAKGRKQGHLLKPFAISNSVRGYKHIVHTTAAERIQYKHATRKNLVAYARADRQLAAALRNCTTRRPMPHERHTGQLILL